MMKFFATSLLFLLIILSVNAQQVTIQGSVEDASNKSPILGATVALLRPADSSIVVGEVTDLDGKFTIADVISNTFILQIQYLGYETYEITINAKKDMDVGTIVISPSAITLDEIVVEATVATGSQRGDTLSFNASAFTTLPDASGRELLEKMPGITVIDGQLQAQGESVQLILVDGKPFFEGDINAALQSLPADVIKSIEIYDKRSDKAEMSGFDDGEKVRTINIITKPGRRRAQFGKTSGGYGTDQRYQLAASVNFFDNDQRFTVTGLSNNINAVDYSANANSQGEARTQDGIIKTNSIGLQYSNTWNEKVVLSGNYKFSDRQNQGMASLFRTYTLPEQEGQTYSQESTQDRKNQDHNLEAKLDYKITDKDRVIIRPSISFVNDKNNDSFDGFTGNGIGLINETHNVTSTNENDYDYNFRSFYSHQFDKKGRSVSLGFNTAYHSNADLSSRQADNIYYESASPNETLDQSIELLRTGINWRAQGSFTEPVGKNSLFELEYIIGDRKNDSDKRIFDIMDMQGSDEKVLNTGLSNVFLSDYLTQEAEIGYQYKVEKLRVQLEMKYQVADLENRQEFPAEFQNERRFTSILPSFSMDYKISGSKNFEVNYNTRTNQPSIGQLQNVIDNSNPLRLVTGNPELDQSIEYNLRARFHSRNSETEQSFYVGINGSVAENIVTNSTLIAEETTTLDNGMVLEKGSQLIRPVNIDGQLNLRSFLGFNTPVRFIKSNLNFWGGLSHNQQPGIINNQSSLTKSNNVNAGLSISSNISDRLDFNVSTRSSYSAVDNTLNPTLTNSFYRQFTNLRYNWIIWKGIIYRTEVKHQLNRGLSKDFNTSFFLVNMSLGKKILKNQLGELSLNVYDLLDQNKNIGRNITGLYVEDRSNTVLQRYFMCTFTYNIRHFSKGTSVDDYEVSDN